MRYTLVPEIIKKTGKSTINFFICLRPGKNLFDALALLHLKAPLQNIYIPWWTNQIPSHAWRSYVILKKTITHTGGKMHTISDTGKTIDLIGLSVKPTSETRLYHDAQFPQFYIEGIIDNNRISIYAP